MDHHTQVRKREKIMLGRSNAEVEIDKEHKQTGHNGARRERGRERERAGEKTEMGNRRQSRKRQEGTKRRPGGGTKTVMKR